MSSSNKIQIRNFSEKRPTKVPILIAQIRSTESDWEMRHGLFYHRNPSRISEKLQQLLLQARELSVSLVIFPELSVPVESLEMLKTWSRETGGIIVGGSHYFCGPNGWRSSCPVIVGGEVFMTDKIYPAPSELSPVAGDSLQPGDVITVFQNTRAGNFAVLICSDYLDPELSGKVIRAIDDGLDLVCIPAFQRNSRYYHDRMAIDCQDSARGIYIAYANMLCEVIADGRSALFGIMHQQYVQKLVEEKLTVDPTSQKIVELPPQFDYCAFDLDIEHKRPFLGQTIQAKPNVEVIKLGKMSDDGPPDSSIPVDKSSLERFVKTNSTIARIDSAIRDAIGKTIVSADQFVETFVGRLLYIGIKSLNHLESALHRDELLVTACAIGWFKHPRGQHTPLIPSGVGISFLCVALIMRDGKGASELRDFWRQFAFDPKADIDELTTVMVDVYQSAIRGDRLTAAD